MKKIYVAAACGLLLLLAACAKTAAPVNEPAAEVTTAVSQRPEELQSVLDNRGSKSNAEVNDEIASLVDAKKQACERLKTEILSALETGFGENPFLTEHMHLETFRNGFLEYYNAALRHVAERDAFNQNVLIPFVFNGGTASGEALLTRRYILYADLEAELQALLNDITYNYSAGG